MHAAACMHYLMQISVQTDANLHSGFMQKCTQNSCKNECKVNAKMHAKLMQK